MDDFLARQSFEQRQGTYNAETGNVRFPALEEDGQQAVMFAITREALQDIAREGMVPPTRLLELFRTHRAFIHARATMAYSAGKRPDRSGTIIIGPSDLGPLP